MNNNIYNEDNRQFYISAAINAHIDNLPSTACLTAYPYFRCFLILSAFLSLSYLCLLFFAIKLPWLAYSGLILSIFINILMHTKLIQYIMYTTKCFSIKQLLWPKDAIFYCDIINNANNRFGIYSNIVDDNFLMIFSKIYDILHDNFNKNTFQIYITNISKSDDSDDIIHGVRINVSMKSRSDLIKFKLLS